MKKKAKSTSKGKKKSAKHKRAKQQMQAQQQQQSPESRKRKAGDDQAGDDQASASSSASPGAEQQQKQQNGRNAETGKALHKRRRKFASGPLSISVNQNVGEIKTADVQQLVLGVLVGSSLPRWAQLTNAGAVRRVVLVLVGGLTHAEFMRHGSEHMPFAFASGAFQHIITRTPGSINRLWDPLSALMSAPADRAASAKRQRELASNQKRPPKFWDLCLSSAALRANEYPIHGEVDESRGAYRNFDEEIGSGPPNPQELGRILGIDCEMVKSAAGLELARVTVVDSNGLSLLDELVAPEAEIIDYVTNFSGITAALLAGVTTRLRDVQQRLRDLMTTSTILVGHSLENDLHALRIIYSKVIDTAVLFPRSAGTGMKHALRHLAKIFLKKTIQGGAGGHDSAEDARTAVELTLLKLHHGRHFGTSSSDSELLFDILLREQVRTVVAENSRILASISSSVSYNSEGLLQLLPAETPADAAEKVEQLVATDVDQRQLVWTHLRMPRAATEADVTTPTGSSTDRLRGFQEIDTQLQRIHRSCIPGTLMIVSSYGDDSVVRRLTRAKYAAEQGTQSQATSSAAAAGVSVASTRPSWTEHEEMALCEAVESTRNALSLVTTT